MSTESSLQFKLAEKDWEFEAIHRLNYKTFVEEIPQHTPRAEPRLVDKFHHENTYVIGLDGNKLAGMVALRGNRPFSLDQKLPNLDSYLPPGRSLCEIRLLAVEKAYRHGHVFSGLLKRVLDYAKKQGWNFALISGTTRQLKLYKHLGFVPFGPLVGTGDALFQPMSVALEAIEERLSPIFTPPQSPTDDTLPVSFLPGPVDMAAEVRAVFAGMPVSHRSRAFVADLQATKQLLRQLTGAAHVEILLGSGSLANDVVAGQLSLLQQPGLVLSNGEFGERLIDHARRFGLSFDALRLPWDEAFDAEHIRRTLRSEMKWLWAVHCETSTGILNDLALFRQLTAERGLKLCLDCISSLGTVPVDLRRVDLASCVSGKGLGAYPGLSMVFYNHPVPPASQCLPRYLDLGFYAAQEGIPFTHSSNLLWALQMALTRTNWPNKFARLVELCAWLRPALRELGYPLVAPDEHASPAVLTLALPGSIRSRTLGWKLEKSGYLLSYRSEYLLKRNWIQICLMGECSQRHLEAVLEILASFRPPQPSVRVESTLAAVSA